MRFIQGAYVPRFIRGRRRCMLIVVLDERTRLPSSVGNLATGDNLGHCSWAATAWTTRWNQHGIIWWLPTLVEALRPSLVLKQDHSVKLATCAYRICRGLSIYSSSATVVNPLSFSYYTNLPIRWIAIRKKRILIVPENKYNSHTIVWWARAPVVSKDATRELTTDTDFTTPVVINLHTVKWVVGRVEVVIMHAPSLWILLEMMMRSREWVTWSKSSPLGSPNTEWRQSY